jgi:hypothetical protein
MDENFEMYRGQLSFCSNKVDEFNQVFKKLEEADIFNNIETLKNSIKDNQQAKENMLKRIEENESCEGWKNNLWYGGGRGWPLDGSHRV